MRQNKIDRHHVMLLEAGEIPNVARNTPKWMHHQFKIQSGNFGRVNFSIEKFVELAETGDNDYVRRSEEMLAQIEDQVPLSRG